MLSDKMLSDNIVLSDNMLSYSQGLWGGRVGYQKLRQTNGVGDRGDGGLHGDEECQEKAEGWCRGDREDVGDGESQS
jgi:hypothetical protein